MKKNKKKDQPTLFDDDPPKKLPDICRNNHGGDEFSEEANRLAHPNKAMARIKILAWIQKNGDSTGDEAKYGLGLLHQACSARFSELKDEGYLTPVFDEDGKQASRKTQANRGAGVWKLSEKGLKLLESAE
jgi:hypothetical protein